MNGSRASGTRRRAAYIRLVPTVALLVVAGVLTACAGPGADQAGQVAESFGRLAKDDPGKACDLLAVKTREEVEKSSEKSCPDALGDEDLPDPSPVLSVDVYGKDAIVRMANDTAFLARFPDGWRITAVSCRPGPGEGKPYDCDISGG
jgi:hypothetical protein